MFNGGGKITTDFKEILFRYSDLMIRQLQRVNFYPYCFLADEDSLCFFLLLDEYIERVIRKIIKITIAIVLISLSPYEARTIRVINIKEDIATSLREPESRSFIFLSSSE
mgnify:CR=1 FL=1